MSVRKETGPQRVHSSTHMYAMRTCLRSTKEERTPNTDWSRSSSLIAGSWDVYLASPVYFFFAGADDITKEREPGIEIIERTL